MFVIKFHGSCGRILARFASLKSAVEAFVLLDCHFTGIVIEED